MGDEPSNKRKLLVPTSSRLAKQLFQSSLLDASGALLLNLVLGELAIGHDTGAARQVIA